MIGVWQDDTPLKRQNKRDKSLFVASLYTAHERSEKRGNNHRPEAPVLWIFVAYTRPPCTITITDIIYTDSYF